MQERLVLRLLMRRLLEELRRLPSLCWSSHSAASNGKRFFKSSQHVLFPLDEQGGNHCKRGSNRTETVIKDEGRRDRVHVAQNSNVCVQVVVLSGVRSCTSLPSTGTHFDRPIRRDGRSVIIDDPAFALHPFMRFSESRNAVLIYRSPRRDQFTGL
jgi:hypothetical protein